MAACARVFVAGSGVLVEIDFEPGDLPDGWLRHWCATAAGLQLHPEDCCEVGATHTAVRVRWRRSAALLALAGEVDARIRASAGRLTFNRPRRLAAPTTEPPTLTGHAGRTRRAGVHVEAHPQQEVYRDFPAAAGPHRA